MTAPEATKGATVVLNRHERDAIRDTVALWLELVEGLCPHNVDDPEQLAGIQETRRLLETHFAMLDDLGWAEHDDRETYTLRITPTVIEWLRDRVAESTDALRKLEPRIAEAEEYREEMKASTDVLERAREATR